MCCTITQTVQYGTDWKGLLIRKWKVSTVNCCSLHTVTVCQVMVTITFHKYNKNIVQWHHEWTEHPPKKQIACFIKLRILKMYFFRWLQESVCNLELLNPVPKRYFKAHNRICLIDTKNSSHQDDPETWFQVRSSIIANRKVEAFFGAHLSCRIILSGILTKMHDVATCLYGTEIDCQWMTLLAGDHFRRPSAPALTVMGNFASDEELVNMLSNVSYTKTDMDSPRIWP